LRHEAGRDYGRHADGEPRLLTKAALDYACRAAAAAVYMMLVLRGALPVFAPPVIASTPPRSFYKIRAALLHLMRGDACCRFTFGVVSI